MIVVVETINIEESKRTQRELLSLGYRWPGGKKALAEITAFQIFVREKVLSSLPAAHKDNPYAYSVEYDHKYFKLPDDKIKFLEYFGVIKKTMGLGGQLVMIRKIHGISQLDVAAKTGYSQTYISRIEKEDPRANPTLKVLNDIAMAIGARITLIPS